MCAGLCPIFAAAVAGSVLSFSLLALLCSGFRMIAQLTVVELCIDKTVCALNEFHACIT
jgi:hypothetical protein